MFILDLSLLEQFWNEYVQFVVRNISDIGFALMVKERIFENHPWVIVDVRMTHLAFQDLNDNQV